MSLTVRGCKVTREVLESWSHRFVFEMEPLYLLDEYEALLPASVIRLTRSELSDAMSLDWHDAYRTWGVSREAARAALVTPAQVRALPEETRQNLDELQVRLNRTGLAETGLRYDRWWALSTAERHDQLVRFVEAEVNTTCRAGSASLSESWPAVPHLAGTFTQGSGPNCFATALAAITTDVEEALGIAGMWLHPSPFVRALEQRGYLAAPMTANPPAGSIVAFTDRQGTMQHACCYLGAGLVLNKNARSWWQPRQVLPLSELLSEWAAEGFSLSLFTPPV